MKVKYWGMLGIFLLVVCLIFVSKFKDLPTKWYFIIGAFVVVCVCAVVLRVLENKITESRGSF